MLLLAAGVGLRKPRNRRLPACVALAALAGPILIDALVNYFFAARQLLFAAPVLALCAAGGIERLRQREWRGQVMRCWWLFLRRRRATTAWRPFRKTASARKPVCWRRLCRPMRASRWRRPITRCTTCSYSPSWSGGIARSPPGAARVVAVISPYSTPEERGQLSQVLDRAYEKAVVFQARRGGNCGISAPLTDVRFGEPGAEKILMFSGARTTCASSCTTAASVAGES